MAEQKRWRRPILRYAAATVILIAVHVVGLWVHSAGVYRGRASVPLQAFPENVDVFFVLTFAPTFLGLKYLAYDFAVQALTKGYRTPALTVCFFAGYLVTLVYDALCLFASTKPAVDAGFAILGTILQSPLILVTFGAVMAVTVLVKTKSRNKQAATPAAGEKRSPCP